MQHISIKNSKYNCLNSMIITTRPMKCFGRQVNKKIPTGLEEYLNPLKTGFELPDNFSLPPLSCSFQNEVRHRRMRPGFGSELHSAYS
jgi:hypothetical protein